MAFCFSPPASVVDENARPAFSVGLGDNVATEKSLKAFKTHGNPQEQRRKALLERQKQARRDITDRVRKLAFATACTGEKRERESEGVSSLEPSTRRAKLQQVSRYYQDQLMLPEPLTEVPADLEQSWLVLPSPPGQRCLVVSYRGHTTSRLPDGKALTRRFMSALPFGSPKLMSEGGAAGSRGINQATANKPHVDNRRGNLHS